MKKKNLPLIVGLIIVLAIVFLFFFGEYLAPYDASVGQESVWVVKENGQRELKRAPFGPDKDHIFGTDNGGRDVLSVIMAGAKNTFTIVFLATLFRFLIAIPISFFAAFGEVISKRLITIFSSTFSAVPSLLICIMILKVDAVKNLDLGPSMVAFIVVFTIVGWGRLANTIEEKIKDILNQDFIQGAIAIGKSKFAIATQNVMAHIMPYIVIYIFLEIALVLLLLAQLGVFEVFVGNKQVFVVKTLGQLNRTNFNFFPEWGAMLASTKRSVIGNRFWLSLFPLLSFSISIIGFNLLGQGLNYELNKRNSMFISHINRLWFHLSPKTFISEIKHFKEKRRNVFLKTIAIISILVLILVPILNSLSIVDNSVMASIMEISKDEYEGRLIGTAGHREFSEYIVDQLKAYKVKPLFKDGYISEFHIDQSINIINDSQLIIKDDFENIIEEFKYKIDYYFENWSSNSLETLEGIILTSADYLKGEFDSSKEYVLVLNPKGSESYIYDKLVSERKDHKYIKGVVVSDIKYSTFTNKRNDLQEKGLSKILENVEAFSDEIPPIKIHGGKRMATKLWSLAGNKISINNRINNKEGLSGKNIGGIIRGKTSESPIIIATSYDYLGFHDGGINTKVEDIIKYKGLYENGTSIASSLELAKYLGNIKKVPERSIIFLFIDGSQITIEGMMDLEKQGIFDEKPIMIYLRYMGINKWNRVDDSLYHSTIVNNNPKKEQEFFRWIRRNSSKTDYYVVGDDLIRERSIMMLGEKDMVGIVFQGIKEKEKRLHQGMIQSNLEEIDVDRLTAHVQYLLDSILDMAYGGKGWTR